MKRLQIIGFEKLLDMKTTIIISGWQYECWVTDVGECLLNGRSGYFVRINATHTNGFIADLRYEIDTYDWQVRCPTAFAMISTRLELCNVETPLAFITLLFESYLSLYP
jgi:hypothetical protein